MFKDTPAARALITYLASPEAATIWAKLGGFSSPNKGVPASAYPDALQRSAATALVVSVDVALALASHPERSGRDVLGHD